ncbi:MAG: metallopeptidase family protein [Sphingomonadales bacterium]|nr:MAG: metallopeptidase family protein [Sphingomonadales bacterium]
MRFRRLRQSSVVPTFADVIDNSGNSPPSTRKANSLLEPSSAEFDAAARVVLGRFPLVFRRELEGVVLRIAEFASDEQLASLGIEDPYELTGLYEGVPLTERSQWDSDGLPPIITLFRQPLLAEMEETGVTFAALIRHVVIHEAGHHFGLSDEDMHAIEASGDD